MSRLEPNQGPELAEQFTEAEEPESPASPLSDLHDSIGWLILGAAILIASLKMSRLTDQHINPYTVPGLVPGLLGIGMMIVGAILGLRSWERHRHQPESPHIRSDKDRLRSKRVLLAVILCCGYSLVLIGHGLPFWLASFIYVTASIFAFDRISTNPAKRKLTFRSLFKTVVIGIGASSAIWLIFEKIFLVRLP
ncbi:MAG TPA: tripartite tricarboxylate transporter TctB family protein [Castellaniella sp.]|uniref:tripartite tricarboxylate transporter TctB family protein n=1 Tax=Castellaniella sp. TaxID=1955812 RepID=UPI002EDCA49F